VVGTVPLSCPAVTVGVATKTAIVVDSPAANRRYLAFMAGSHSSRVRLIAYAAFKDDPEFLVLDPKQRVAHHEYLCMMAQSVFCLVPRGQAAWSPRLDEAMYAGCIPVIIADGYDPPFSAILNYSLFSVRVSEADLVGGRVKIADKSTKFGVGLTAILKAISEVSRGRHATQSRSS
jgi:hypothetical protein